MMLVPCALITFILSLIIGYFIAEPLRLLLSKLTAYRVGVPVSFEPDTRLYEADELSESTSILVRKLESQQSDLVREGRRQSEFVSDVAHELRTPLTAIRGNAEMLQDPDLPPSMRERFTSIIVSESERLSRLVSDLLALQRIENDATQPAELARINLRSLAQDVVDALHSLLEEREANVRIVGEAPDVLGNADRLKEALTNLVENASRFIDPGGHISIELSGLHGNAIIQVKDDGTGFGDIDPNLLFGRFYRADASRARNTGGTGLGLSIVKSIVESHDGTVEALNRVGGGAVFIIAIPAIEE
ncbi:MAG: sensor histidine kinase [Coriobacteriaceae bacterium]|nr:sensor histidine kinase [Coriobacteriaceae bacterium]